jgi:hypothetical protein
MTFTTKSEALSALADVRSIIEGFPVAGLSSFDLAIRGCWHPQVSRCAWTSSPLKEEMK